MIEILPTETINQIAAGEVVERPFSVIKETLENSIDAGADDIKIYVEEFGIGKIQIIDNGLGIPQNDLDKLFLKHSTSKIRSIKDLENINTFGFRGEALASIASISKVSLHTKHINDNSGFEVSVTYGGNKSIKPSNILKGTNIIIKDLFGNIPVRRKFLKTPNTENNLNWQTILKFIISHPDISFYVNIEGRIFNFDKTDIEARISEALKLEVDDLIPIQDEISNNNDVYRINGFLIHPRKFLKTKKYQYIFVNQRAVSDQIISKAISDALKNLLMHDQVPGYIIFLSLPSSEVDVNVHPRKTEVRFRNNSLVYHKIKSCAYNSLQNHLKQSIKKIIQNPTGQVQAIQDNDSLENHSNIVSPSFNQKRTSASNALQASISNTEITNSLKHSYKQKFITSIEALNFNKFILEATNLDRKNLKQEDSPTLSLIDDKNQEENKIFTNAEQNLKIQTNQVLSLSNNLFSVDFQNATQLLNSYIITANQESIIIIDQHAASERILYEKYLNSIKANNIVLKVLVTPLVITNLDPFKIELILSKRKIFEYLGFKIDLFGHNLIRILEVPDFIRLQQFESTFYLIADEVIENLEITGESELSDTFITANNVTQQIIHHISSLLACHSAIRFGDKLPKEEIQKLIKDLMSCENPYSCPHGRPIMIEYKITEIQKKLRRCT